MQTEKNRAWVIPPITRPAASTAKLGAAAATTLLSTYPAMVESRTGLRGSRLVASASGTESTATMTAYALTSSPAVPLSTSNAAPFCGRRPTGRSSVVTAANTATARTSSPGRAAPSPASVGPSEEVTAPPSHRKENHPQGHGAQDASASHVDGQEHTTDQPVPAPPTPDVTSRIRSAS